MHRFLKLLVSVIGIAVIVMGIIFMFQSGSAKQQVADTIAPVTLSQLNATYNTVTANLNVIMQTEEQNIETGGQPSVMYSYLTAEEAGLGLAKSNVGTANLLLTMGIIDVIIGLGLIAGIIVLPGKEKA